MFPTEPTKTVENYHHGAWPAGFSAFNGETGRFRVANGIRPLVCGRTVAGAGDPRSRVPLGAVAASSRAFSSSGFIKANANESACGAEGAGRAGSRACTSPRRPGPAGSFPIPNQRFAQLLFEDDPPCASDSIELGQQAGGM